MKKTLLLLIVVAANCNLFGQAIDSADFAEQPKSIYQVFKQLGADTVVFYYNDRWQLVKPVCATRFRITRIDSVLITFTGAFVEWYSDTTKEIEGNYLDGKKEGDFKLYFPNGQLEQAGKYSNDKKTGIWEYYYENGGKHQRFEFKDNEIFIIDFWDEKGQRLVESGNGNWFGFETPEKFIRNAGKVADGRKNGTWERTIPSRKLTVNSEKYKDGNFISGKMFSPFSGTETYKNKSFCITELTPGFLAAEKFETNRCYTTPKKNNWEFAEYPGGMQNFYRQVKEKLILTSSVNTAGLIQVRTVINTEGKMTDFKPLSNTGNEYLLIGVLQSMDNWIPAKANGKPMIQPKIISFEISN